MNKIMGEVYHLPLSPDYVSSWTTIEAVREILQNAIDSDSAFEWEFDCETLLVRSAGVKLSAKSLLLGNSSKQKGDKIGSFGEGFKLALLVLCREGKPVIVQNGDLIWQASFEYVRKFESNMLTITETRNPEPDQGLVFQIGDLDFEERKTIIGNCLHMQPDIGEVVGTSKGRILKAPDYAGKLFVGGLFICETGLKYGYDINPEHITLERDRQTVSSFDLKFMTKDMWFEIDEPEHVASMIESEVPDLEYANYSTPNLVKEACYRLFRKRNPDSIAVRTQKELDELVSRGMTNVVVVPGSAFRDIVSSDPANLRTVIASSITPTMVLKEFMRANKSYMNRTVTVAFKKLIEKSEKWK